MWWPRLDVGEMPGGGERHDVYLEREKKKQDGKETSWDIQISGPFQKQLVFSVWEKK